VKRILLGTNWKMHKTVEEAVAYTTELKRLSSDIEGFEIFIIPPYTDLWEVKKIVKGSSILLGAQNMGKQRIFTISWLRSVPFYNYKAPFKRI